MVKDLGTRALTGIILAGLLVLLCILAAWFPAVRWVLLALGFLVAGLSAFEFSQVCAVGEPAEFMKRFFYCAVCLVPSLVVLLAASSAGAMNPSGFPLALHAFVGGSAAFVVAILLAFTFMFVHGQRDLVRATLVSRELFIGAILIGYGGAMLLVLATFPLVHRLLPWLVLVVCLNDIAAYLVGSRVGGRKLAEAISPKKTIAGSLAGIAAGGLGGVVFSFLLPAYITIWSAGSAALLLVMAAQIGDLAKSYVKRLHGVKDCGHILPGHGGVLDRVDGLLMAAPLFVCWLFALGVE